MNVSKKQNNKNDKQKPLSKRKSNSKKSNKQSKRGSLVFLKISQLKKVLALIIPFITYTFWEEIKVKWNTIKHLYLILKTIIKIIFIWR